MLNNELLMSPPQSKVEPFCIDFTNSAKDGSVTISTNTQNSFNYSIDDESYNQLANAGDTISVPKGSKLYMKGVNKVSRLYTRGNNSNAWTITGDNVKLLGNIQDLLSDSDNDTLDDDRVTGQYTFAYLFYNNASIVDVSELILPATTLASYCYIGMFQKCSSLTTAPELPATTLADYCYKNMFYGCSNLTAAPELPATTLASGCYIYMFNGCSSLTTAPELPATTLASDCYMYMFNGCSSLTTAPELPATTLASSCYNSMFNGCSSLTTAPELRATILADWCYSYMFAGCKSLTTAPELPATILTTWCYTWMFQGCSKLNYVKCLATDISATVCTSNWLLGVASTGTFVKNPSMNNWTIGANGIPSGWTVQDYTPPFCIDFTNSTTDGSVKISTNTQNSFNYSIDDESYNQLANAGDTISVPQGSKLYMKGVNKVASLFTRNASLNAWTVTGDNVKLSGNIQDLLNDGNNDTLTGQYTFIRLFSGNVSIVDATELILPATSLARSCYGYMFDGCSNLTAAPELPATTLASGCYSCMFTGCTRLTTAPHLPATTLVSGCYSFMFEGCSSLTTAPELPATTLADKCCQYMFEGCSSLTTAPELPATTLADYCYRYMFYGCSKLNYVKCLATNISAINCTNSWLHGVSSTGTFVKNPAMNSWNTDEDGIPSGWTVQNA